MEGSLSAMLSVESGRLVDVCRGWEGRELLSTPLKSKLLSDTSRG